MLRPSRRAGQLEKAAKRIRQLHLPWGPTFCFKHRRRRHQNGQALCSRSRNVEAIERIQKLHSARGVGVARCRHRIDADRRFLPLKLVDGSNARARQPVVDLENLRIVRGNDQDVRQGDWALDSIPINPGGSGSENFPDDFANTIRFFGRAALISFGDDRHVSEAGPGKPRRRTNALDFQSRTRVETTGIEKLGSVTADVGMKPPSFGEEESLVSVNRRFAVEQVVQRRDVRTFRMAALHRLLELLGVADQNHAPSRLRHREDVRERHLRRLIDEEHFHGVGGIGQRPEPCSPPRPHCYRSQWL